ncbi:hypothetical protein [Oscillibacter sp.]|uniref:hypothetical protein n=1 Tax=Oscillibacter sp. TaxID=1945593 RepID=UPI00289C2ECF|nr:hypothetical protein [Oscillibacter sp.]
MNDLEADLLIANAKIKQLEQQLAESQRRDRAAETAMEEMTYIIQKAACRRCDYCIYRTEPCQARGLHAECDFEYVGERGPLEAGEGEAE